MKTRQRRRICCTLFISNLDAVTFTVEFAAAANQSEFLRTAYAGYRDTQRRQLANLLHGIAGDRAPTSLIDETVHLVETGLLGMSMRRPFISDGTGLGRLRIGYVESVTDLEDAP